MVDNIKLMDLRPITWQHSWFFNKTKIIQEKGASNSRKPGRNLNYIENINCTNIFLRMRSRLVYFVELMRRQDVVTPLTQWPKQIVRDLSSDKTVSDSTALPCITSCIANEQAIGSKLIEVFEKVIPQDSSKLSLPGCS